MGSQIGMDITLDIMHITCLRLKVFNRTFQYLLLFLEFKNNMFIVVVK